MNFIKIYYYRTNEPEDYNAATEFGFNKIWDQNDQLFLLNMLKMAKNSREDNEKSNKKYLETVL